MKVEEKMVKQKTFIITISVLILIFLTITIGMKFYYESKIKEAIEEKESIVILNDEITGLENVIVE